MVKREMFNFSTYVLLYLFKPTVKQWGQSLPKGAFEGLLSTEVPNKRACLLAKRVILSSNPPCSFTLKSLISVEF